MTAYYNEIDPYAAQWLRNLINAGHIAPGIVDERSIEDVHPSDLRGFTQCHFFAGIGVWSHSLRAAGWPDDRPVWTGSCPCQPFSAAGKGSGFDDQRHLWPAFHHLIQECKPAIILGEQVASKDADPWVNLVQADVEALGYGFGAVPFPAACVGAPHIRDRLYWVADTKQHHRGSQAAATHHGQQEADRPTDRTGGCGVLAGRMANDNEKRWGRRQGLSSGCDDDGKDAGRFEGDDGLERIGEAGVFGVENTGCRQQQECRIANQVPDGKQSAERSANSTCRRGSDASEWAMEIAGMSTGPANGHWRDADWLLCRDGKWRPVEPGTFPLVDGAAGGMGRVRADWHTPAGKEGFGHRAGRLKGYGNAINAEAARIFIECVMEVRA